MRVVTKPIVLAVSAVFGLGLVTAAAADNHGAVVSAIAKASTSLTGSARGEAVSDTAQTNGKSAASSRGVHGEAVSTVATSDATIAHTTGAMKTNHGGAVSKTAHKP